jgi:hypothetical protein
VREATEYNDNFSNYYDSIEQVVPETTFNNMHGKLRDINSVDGQTWKSFLEKRMENNSYRTKSKISKDEFKLNVSGWWTKEDVWGSSGWEVRSNIVGTLHNYGKSALSWKKYETSRKSYNAFLQHLSQLTWPEQTKFKEVFDKYVKAPPRKSIIRIGEDNSKKVGNLSTEGNRKSLLPQSMGLKQLGRSIKYMTAAEKREEQKKKG